MAEQRLYKYVFSFFALNCKFPPRKNEKHIFWVIRDKYAAWRDNIIKFDHFDFCTPSGFLKKKTFSTVVSKLMRKFCFLIWATSSNFDQIFANIFQKRVLLALSVFMQNSTLIYVLECYFFLNFAKKFYLLISLLFSIEMSKFYTLCFK